ncbi:YadA-like family protein [Allisonella histaminiformans]|uniref:YadA-like family protein n=1 Tax=Allisonella histaminiformans TaxID=209880 RepID=UPI0029425DE6|nr:YadA-like family protein [Allisonella histaminiformans]
MAVAVLTGFAMPAQAAVSIGTDGTVKAEAADINALNNLLKNGVTTNKDGSVTVGGLTVKKNGEVSVNNSPDVVYGKNAKITWDSNNTMGQISIGNNATVVTGHGGQEKAFAYDGDFNHAAGAIAIGANTYARTGSIMIGSHVYKGNMGDVKNIDTDSFNTGSDGAYGFTVNSTTIGTNSFTRGNLATTIGDYNIQSGRSVGHGWQNALNYGAQNFGATVIGALNSNESQSDIVSSSFGTSTSGVANSIVGVANRVNSSNGTLVFGAGNEVTHSLSDIYGVGDTTSLKDAKKAQDALKNAVAESNAGGAVLAIGGANKADWAQKSQLIGVGNTLTGASSAVSEYNMINGYKNEVTNATHTTIIGSNNTATNIKSTIVMGDHNTLKDRKNVISLGNNNTVTADGAVAIGNGTTVEAEGGVAIGVGSVADRVAGIEKGVLGAFAPETIPTEEKSTWCSTRGAVSVGYTVGNITRQITNVAAGSEDTDAVNVAQLKKALESIDVDAGTGIKVDKIIKDGKTTYKISTNIVGSETTTDKTTVTPKETNTGSTDTSQGTTNGTSTKTGNTVTVSTETKATSFGADNNQKADVKPGGTLNINGDGNNILTSISTSTSDNSSSIKVELKKDITVDSVTANSVKVGDTSISTDGLTIQGGPSITKTGIDGGNRKVTGVEAGEISSTSKDAVNGSQLFATNQQVVQNAQSISKLGNRINKVGAGAAALAALHPLDFDPDDKWDFAAGYGNYNGENAVAIGAYYRPNEDTMFSVGGSFGNGENMVNAGVSLKLGQGNHVSTSKVAMAKEIKDLRKEMEGLKSALLDANAGKKLDTSKLQLFPDVPKNHWAYEYVSTLKGNGMLTGYPDGEFKGDRPMTRYEFATMLYKAMLEGATLSDKILKEFAPELERFTVDTVHQDKDGKPTVERVRMVKAAK